MLAFPWCVALSAAFALLLPACGPCEGGGHPKDGTCTCDDGEVIEGSDCPECSDSDPVDLGLAESSSVRGSVSSLCGRSYDLDVAGPAQLTLTLNASANVTATVRRTRGGESIGSATASAGADGNLTLPVSQGSYVIMLTTGGAEAVPYSMDVDATSYGDGVSNVEPGGSPGTAYDLGSVSEVLLYTGYVGASNEEDFFRLSIEEDSELTWQLSDVEGSAIAELFIDAKLIDTSAPFRQIRAASGTDKTETVSMQRGIYYARVTASPGQPSLYSIGFSAEPYEAAQLANDPGGNRNAAHNLGELTGLMSVGGFVGSLDDEDYYRFEITSNATVLIALSEVKGDVYAQLFYDAALIDEASPAVQIRGSIGEDATTAESLPEGIYYVRVVPVSYAESLYTLSLSLENDS